MKIGGLGLGDHIRLLMPLFIFIAAVWLLRILLDAAHVPHLIAHAFSVTAAETIAIFLAVLLMEVRQTGGYINVVVASIMLTVWGQILIVAAILFSVVTGITNVFTQPEFSVPGDDKYHVRHILGHLTYGIGLGIIFGAAMGCVLLLLLRVLVPPTPKKGR
ncbi:MAG TPA: hypothetical protein VFC63_27190 [Blastocatellia bacterium]|nr:hypothetical protein [Blastocatellia bacterium]